jgi:hypothetical protein
MKKISKKSIATLLIMITCLILEGLIPELAVICTIIA